MKKLLLILFFPLWIYSQEPNDTKFDDQLNMADSTTTVYNTTLGNDIGMVKAWEIERGSADILVGILDTYADSTNPDLKTNFAGYKNFASTIQSSEYHGTAVCGLIAAKINNDTLIAGIAGGWDYNSGVKWVNYRMSNNDGLATNDAIQAIIYAAGRVDVINCSFGTGLNKYMKNAVSYYLNKNRNHNVIDGAIMCAAIGNIASDYIAYPAAYVTDFDGILAVAATDCDDVLMATSNYGDDVSLTAPAEYIYTTTRLSLNPLGYTYYPDGGTSLATPQVVGAVALLISKYPRHFTKKDITDLIINSADNIDAENPSKVGKLGGGRLNVYNALKDAETLVQNRKFSF